MAHHERTSIPRNDLSARDEFAVPQDVTFLNAANIGPAIVAGSAVLGWQGYASWGGVLGPAAIAGACVVRS
jgi:hypothetical protein